MKDRHRQKGVALLMVSGLVLIIFAGVMGLLFVMEANIRNLESVKERTQAYYLCEVGASVAILDIAHGKVGTQAGQWTERSFDYTMSDKAYPIKYTVKKVSGDWQVTSEVGRLAGFSRTYKLRIGGRRAFPIFIRGFGGR